jgi:hypothetical protein
MRNPFDMTGKAVLVTGAEIKVDGGGWSIGRAADRDAVS